MSLYTRKDSKIWWINISDQNGKRIRESTGTKNKREAQEYHDRRKSEVWRQGKLNEKPRRTWEEAVVRFLKEKQNNKSYSHILGRIKQLDRFLKSKHLDEINEELISEIIETRRSEPYQRRKGGKYFYITERTVNHNLSVLRSLLNCAKHNWRWIDKTPRINLLSIPKSKRLRLIYITKEQARRLIEELPDHLKSLVIFSLSTGLRESNVTLLEWKQIDLKKKIALIHADQSKSGKDIPVPLNQNAIDILIAQKGKHPIRVFTYKGKPIRKANNTAWKKALDRAGIAPYIPPDVTNPKHGSKGYPSKDLSEYEHSKFRWHDLRHTWASWHVQSGTPLAVLQKLGGWSCYEMVLRYAHLTTDHTSAYADKVNIGLDDFGPNITSIHPKS